MVAGHTVGCVFAVASIARLNANTHISFPRSENSVGRGGEAGVRAGRQIKTRANALDAVISPMRVNMLDVASERETV